MSLWLAIKNRFVNFWYNEDRAGASLLYGTDQDTISSMVGRGAARDPVEDAVQDTLDAAFPGHTQSAIAHADVLNQAEASHASR